MIPSPFDYKQASSVKEALALLAEGGEDAYLLAGGHSLIPAMKLRMNSATVLIDISRIPEIHGIREEANAIHIGALTTHGEIEHSDVIQSHLPVMSSAASLIGDPQVRNKGTIGGSLAHADPAADWPGVLVALNATIHVTSNDGERVIPAEKFFMGLFTTALLEGELISSITVPKAGSTGNATYLKFAQPASRYAIVGCAAYLEKEGDICSEVRIAFNGVSGHAFRDRELENELKGKKLDASTIDEACQHAASNVHVMSDHFASENYRKHLATVFAARAVTALS